MHLAPPGVARNDRGFHRFPVGMYLAKATRVTFSFEEGNMPEKKTLQAAQEDKREGKSPTTQAGEFVREEMHHVREGKHGARNPKQAIAIGLSKARRAGVHLPAPGKGQSAETRSKAARDEARGKHPRKKTSATRSRAVKGALKREGRAAASHSALSKQTKSAARKRGGAARSAAARKAVRTKGPTGRKQAARKAARTRARRRG